MFKIGIIDSGIDHDHPRLKNCLTYGIHIHKNKKQQIKIIPGNFHDDVGHGTAIASIIHKIVPGVELFAVKLTSADNNITEDLLIQAFNSCLQVEGLKVINISMGVDTKEPNSALYNAVKEIVSKEIFICASAHNIPSRETYPAYFTEVLGITSGIIKNKLEYGYCKNEKINFIAKGTTQRIAWSNKGYRITSGNSFATANFSGLLALKLLSKPKLSYKGIFDLLIDEANTDVRILQYTPDDRDNIIANYSKETLDSLGTRLFTNNLINNVKKIALFPTCEKEIGTIISFQNQCPFKITRCFDYPRNLSTLYNKDCKSVEISRNIEDHYFNDFDTLVCGYFLDQKFDANILFGYELLETAIKKNKNIITWDSHVYKYIKSFISKSNINYSGKVIVPYANNKLFEEVMRYRYLPIVSVPTILVIGSSNKQGKVTTQLRIKEILQSEGYKVSHISTEPQGIVLGAEFTFPFGHKTTVDLSEELWGRFINVVTKGVEYYNKPNIIITGTQGKYIPRSKNLEELTSEGLLSCIYYTCGVVPDAIIIAINPQDSIKLIKDIIKITEIFTNAKILFLVMTPLERNYNISSKSKVISNNHLLNAEEYGRKLKYFQSKLKTPVIDVLNKSNNKFILKTIEETFSKKL